MTDRMAGPEILRLIDLIAKLPGYGPRSARRAALHLIRHREGLMGPLADALAVAADKVETCIRCGNIDTCQPCSICRSPRRDEGLICVVEAVPDLWAMERAGAYGGLYHVLGGVMSALDGVGPEDLNIRPLRARIAGGARESVNGSAAGSDTAADAPMPPVREVILALSATVDGQATASYVTEALEGANVRVTRLARGVPVGGELEQLDDGTLATALRARREIEPAPGAGA